MITTREWAILIWGCVFLVWACAAPKVRSSLWQVVRAAAEPKILIPFGGFCVWVVGEMWLASKLIAWNAALAKGAVVWFVTVGVVLFFNLSETSKDPGFLRRKAIESIAVPALIIFYLDLYPLPFVAEMVLQPALVALVVVSAVAALRKEHARVKSCTDILMGIVALSLLGYVTVQTSLHWRTMDRLGVVKDFGLSVWLTVGALPFVFLLALYASYELVFARLRLQARDTAGPTMQNRWALITAFHGNLREVSELARASLFEIASARTYRETRAAVRKYRARRRAERRRILEEERRLRDLAGIRGVDAEGRQLDRREFKETIESLLWLDTCMSGWYRRGQCYRADLLSMLEGSFERHGLKSPYSIVLHVAPDGQAWYAWRRTITGWCFAIGAAGPPPNTSRYDGPEPPEGFPSSDPAWGPDGRNW